MLSCLFVSFFYNGSDIIPFVWSILITVGAGFIFRLLGRHADNLLGRRDAYFCCNDILDSFYDIRYTPLYD